MSEEKEQIEKMVSQGKITSEEGDRLMNAIDKSNAIAKTSNSNEETGNRSLSKLAIAGMLCGPVAVLLGTLVTTISKAAGVRYAEAEQLGTFLALALLAIGVILSISACISIKRNPEQLYGFKLGLAGIIIPLLIFAFIFLYSTSGESPAGEIHPSGYETPPAGNSILKVGMELSEAEQILRSKGIEEEFIDMIPGKSSTGEYYDLKTYPIGENKRKYIGIVSEKKDGKLIVIELFLCEEMDKAKNDRPPAKTLQKYDLGK